MVRQPLGDHVFERLTEIQGAERGKYRRHGLARMRERSREVHGCGRQ